MLHHWREEPQESMGVKLGERFAHQVFLGQFPILYNEGLQGLEKLNLLGGERVMLRDEFRKGLRNFFGKGNQSPNAHNVFDEIQEPHLPGIIGFL